MTTKRDSPAAKRVKRAEKTASLLVELLCEELPPQGLFQLAHEFGVDLCVGLQEADLLVSKADYNKAKQEHLSAFAGENYAAKSVKSWGFVAYPTSRRLAFVILDVRKETPAIKQTLRGPAKSIAYTGGKPSKALIGFLRANDAREKDLIEINKHDKPYVALERKNPRLSLDALMGKIIEDAIKKTSAPKMMRWFDNDWKFVRPIRNLCVVHGTNPVQADVFNMKTRGFTVGHRFLQPREFALTKKGGADRYVATMKENKVLVNPWERQNRIKTQVEKIESKINSRSKGDKGGKAFRVELPDFEDDDNVRMTEWPTASVVDLSEDYFLKNKIPYKIAKACIEKHLRSYVVMCDDKKRPLSSRFVFVADNQFDAESKKKHIEGLKKVFQSRLDDASQLYGMDLVSFTETEYMQGQLRRTAYLPFVDGSMMDRSERLESLAGEFAKKLAPNDEGAVRELATAAAAWCQIDLVSRTLEEYPQLAGYVAASLLRDGKEANEDVCALLANWKSATVERNKPALHSLILADEIDRLALFAALGRLPSGSSDPHGLRTSAQRVMSVLSGYENGNLSEFVGIAEKNLAAMKKTVDDGSVLTFKDTKEAMGKLVEFALGRLVHVMHESGDDDLGSVTPRLCQAVTAGLKYGDEIDVHAIFERAAALSLLSSRHDAQLRRAMVLHKRLYNISKKEDLGDVDESKLESKAEIRLFDALSKIKILNYRMMIVDTVEDVFLVKLLPHVEDFFSEVRLDVDDKELAQNRFALVGMAKKKFDSVADFRRLYS